MGTERLEDSGTACDAPPGGRVKGVSCPGLMGRPMGASSVSTHLTPTGRVHEGTAYRKADGTNAQHRDVQVGGLALDPGRGEPPRRARDGALLSQVQRR